MFRFLALNTLQISCFFFRFVLGSHYKQPGHRTHPLLPLASARLEIACKYLNKGIKFYLSLSRISEQLRSHGQQTISPVKNAVFSPD